VNWITIALPMVAAVCLKLSVFGSDVADRGREEDPTSFVITFDPDQPG
jgi:hypothetical protein